MRGPVLCVLVWAMLVPAFGSVPEGLWEGAPPKPGLSLRAETMMLPLYGGIPLYNDMWSGFGPNDRSTDNAFHDRAAWRARFAHLCRLRLNGLVLLHPHPFVLFVDYRGRYPEAAWLTDGELAAKREMLRWLIATGREYGVSLYFLTWNIWLPRGFAAAHHLEQHSVDTPLTREFMRWSVAEFFRTYPGFGGLVTMAAETPPGCIGFVKEGIVAGMRQVTPRPQLLFWLWCSYPWQAKEVLDAYDGDRIALSYLQYEQFFAPLADPRLGEYSHDLGGAPMAALGGPKSALAYLLFAHPGFIHGIVSDFYRRRNGRGLLIEEVGTPERWLAEEAFARYAWNPQERYRDDFWEARVAERYGSRALARPLLSLLQSASLIVPTQMKLTHSQTDHFMPQMGLTLAQVLEMPTISTYVFENSQEQTPQGYLTPNLGESRPNPDWGERVLPIRQWVLGRIPDRAERRRRISEWMEQQRRSGFNPKPERAGDRTPLHVVRQLERLLASGERAAARSDAARSTATRAPQELARILDLARMSLALGRYFVEKDRAAIAWERYRVLGSPDDARRCVAHLERSVDAWRQYAAWGDRLHPAGAWYWQSALNAPPPWTQNEIWESYVARHSRFGDLTPVWEREVERVRERLRQASPRDREFLAPPVMDELRAPVEGGEAVAHFDFEAEADPRFQLAPTPVPRVEVTEDPRWVLQGRRSLLADSRGSREEWHLFFMTVPEKVRLLPNARYQVRVRYRVVEPGRFRTPFAMALRTQKGGVPNDVGDQRTWGGSPGTVSERVLIADTKGYDDYALFFSLRGEAALVIDDVLIERLPGAR